MRCSILLILMSMLTAVNMINRPVYKIVLKQKGFAQFLQYDIETPPLREFTFCTWIRVYDLSRDQSIFRYMANNDNRLISLWLESGGHNMKISFNGRVTATAAVNIAKQVWRHLCLSYQSDYGTWALYVDSRLVSCETSQSLYGYIIPGSGSVILGYGTAKNGAQNGFEGEIFGANMILASTIERNYTVKNNPLHEQKPFAKNKVRGKNENSYTVLSDLQTDEIHNNYENTELSVILNTEKNNKSYIKFKNPFHYLEHDVGIELTPSTLTVTNNPSNPNSRNTINDAKSVSSTTLPEFEQTRSEYHYLATISEYETPPPLLLANKRHNYKTIMSAAPLSIYKNSESSEPLKLVNNNNIHKGKISEVEIPPPLQDNTKVYGQWTRSKFAGNVLNYLKSINYKNREQKKIPPTIPLLKISDSLPYPSEFKPTRVLAPSPFQRQNFMDKRYDAAKSSPQINVQILKEDLRNNIIKSHAKTQPKHVEIINRGETKKSEHRFYRNVNVQDVLENIDSKEEIFKPNTQNKRNHNYSSEVTLKNNDLSSIFPFLKSSDHFVDDSSNTQTKNVENIIDMYSKTLSTGNKWHNVKSYNNDYTPRRLIMDGINEIEQRISDYNKKNPSVRLNYKHSNYKTGKSNDVNIEKARELAEEVSNQSNINVDSMSPTILKYNHGFLPNHNKKGKNSEKHKEAWSSNSASTTYSENNFNKRIKIGNALNERLVLGVDDRQKKVSFVGGDEKIPDILRYRSDLEAGGVTVPGSLAPRVCKNVEFYDRVLYVQPDESIDMTHIFSSVRVKNLGIEFIIQNYKKCSLSESIFEKSDLLFISWVNTPVRLFGGAYPRTTTDLCGFF